MNLSGMCFASGSVPINYGWVTCETGMSGTFGYTAVQEINQREEKEWINDPFKVSNEYIWRLGSEDPIMERNEHGKMVPYVRRYAIKQKPVQVSQPRENHRPAPEPKGIKKEVRIAGFGANQKLKL